MNNSAFKANVHLNIISLASLFFFLSVKKVVKKKRSFQTTWTVAEVHFVKMQTLMDFHFLTSPKVQNDILWIFTEVKMSRHFKKKKPVRSDAPSKASVSLSLQG